MANEIRYIYYNIIDRGDKYHLYPIFTLEMYQLLDWKDIRDTVLFNKMNNCVCVCVSLYSNLHMVTARKQRKASLATTRSCDRSRRIRLLHPRRDVGREVPLWYVLSGYRYTASHFSLSFPLLSFSEKFKPCGIFISHCVPQRLWSGSGWRLKETFLQEQRLTPPWLWAETFIFSEGWRRTGRAILCTGFRVVCRSEQHDPI